MTKKKEIKRQEVDVSPFYYLSEADLYLLDEYRNNVDMPKEQLEKILFTNGLDINKPYELLEDTHRTLRNKIYTGKRWFGRERLDKDWQLSGCASIEAVIASSKDPEHRFTLRQMSAQGWQIETIDDDTE